MIVDIRDTSAWKKDGIDGSVCIPLRHIKDNLDMLSSQDSVVFVCHSGLHSRKLAHKYRDLFNCYGGRISAHRLIVS